MSKAMRSLVCVMLSMVMMLSMNVWAGVTASAEETTIEPRFSYTNYTFTGLSSTTTGVATCHADVEGYYGITTKIHIEMHLQQYLALQWTTIAVWEGTFNDVFGVLDESKQATSSGRYRTKAIYTVYSGSASEEITGYSQERYITVP